MRKAFLIAAFVFASVTLALAAAPPGAINYQGVLRDSADNPLDGSYDMQFHFMDADVGGNALLTDEHLALGTGAVTVSGGLFNVEIGSGNLVDPGSGYTSLAEVFQNHTDVWVEITVGVETLAPRVKVAAAAYALKADHLGGMAAGDFIDTSAVAQVKTGNLTVGDLTVGGGDLLLPGGGEIEGNSSTTTLHGNSDTDRLFLFAGADATAGGIRAYGDGILYLDGGIGYFSFRDQSVSPSIETAKLTAGGNFQIDGDLTVDGDQLYFGSGAYASNSTTGLRLYTGAESTDDLFMYAGSNYGNGGLYIYGDSFTEIQSGDGRFLFDNGATGATTAELGATGDLQIDGDLTVDGYNMFFGSDGGEVRGFPASTSLINKDDTDDLFLYAGNNSSDGALLMYGDSSTYLYSGNGYIYFNNGDTGLQTARLDPTGNFQMDGNLDVDGSTVALASGMVVTTEAANPVFF